jgi:hypothetical protein
MVEKIAEDKNRILEYMGKSLEKYGPDKMNVEEIGKLADAIKDMAEAEKACWEAEYYRSVTEAMDGQGYTPDMMGYQGGGQGRMGYNRNRDSMGRYSSGRRGYHDGMDGLRAEMQSATPEEREKMKRELRQMLDM